MSIAIFVSNLTGILTVANVLLILLMFFISIAVIIIVISFFRRNKKTRPFTFMSLRTDSTSNIDTHINNILNVLYSITEYSKIREEIIKKKILSNSHIAAVEFFDIDTLNVITSHMNVLKKQNSETAYIKNILESNFRQVFKSPKYKAYYKECNMIYNNLAKLIDNNSKLLTIRESTNIYNYLDLETIVKEKSIFDNNILLKYDKFLKIDDSMYDWIPEDNKKTFDSIKKEIKTNDVDIKKMLLDIYRELNEIYSNANYDYFITCQSNKSEEPTSKKQLKKLEKEIDEIEIDNVQKTLDDIDNINNIVEALLHGKNSFNEHLIHTKQKYRDKMTSIKMYLLHNKNMDTINDAFFLTLKMHLEEKMNKKKLIAWLKTNIQLNQELLYLEYELNTNLENIQDYDKRTYVCTSEIERFWKRVQFGYLHPFNIYWDDWEHLAILSPSPNELVYSIVSNIVSVIPTNDEIVKNMGG